MKKYFKTLLKDESAQGLAEYVLILFIFTVASIGAVGMFVKVWKIKFNKICLMRTGMFGVIP